MKSATVSGFSSLIPITTTLSLNFLAISLSSGIVARHGGHHVA